MSQLIDGVLVLGEAMAEQAPWAGAFAAVGALGSAVVIKILTMASEKVDNFFSSKKRVDKKKQRTVLFSEHDREDEAAYASFIDPKTRRQLGEHLMRIYESLEKLAKSHEALAKSHEITNKSIDGLGANVEKLVIKARVDEIVEKKLREMRGMST